MSDGVLSLPPAVRIFVATAPTNMHLSFDRLAALARDVCQQDPRSGHLFAFFRPADRVKILYGKDAARANCGVATTSQGWVGSDYQTPSRHQAERAVPCATPALPAPLPSRHGLDGDRSDQCP
jgi:hypothetical protein